MELTKKENEIKLMAAWKTQVRDLVRRKGWPKFDVEVGDEYILYECDCDYDPLPDPLEDAEESYENGWRLVSTKTEKIPDLYGTGYALKLVK